MHRRHASPRTPTSPQPVRNPRAGGLLATGVLLAGASLLGACGAAQEAGGTAVGAVAAVPNAVFLGVEAITGAPVAPYRRAESIEELQYQYFTGMKRWNQLDPVERRTMQMLLDQHRAKRNR